MANSNNSGKVFSVYMNIIVSLCLCKDAFVSPCVWVGTDKNLLVRETIQSSLFSSNASRKTGIKPTITYSSHKSWLKILTVAYWSEDSGKILQKNIELLPWAH